MIKNVFARYLAILLIGGALIGGTAVALAGMASAASTTQPTGPGYSYAPSVKAHPAPTQQPGWHHHHGIWHVTGLQK